MKRLIMFLLIFACAGNIFAQTDSTKVKILNKNVVTVVEEMDGTNVKVGGDNGIEVITDDRGDTTSVRVGRRTFRVVDGHDGTHINVTREERGKRWTGHFNAHWAGLEFGMNIFPKVDYSLYSRINTVVPADFMDLNPGKSLTVNLNFAEYAFRNEKNNFALVTGLGFSFMDYTFDQPLTLVKSGNGVVIPVELSTDGLKKSKLNVTYLTAPLMLEIKTPLKFDGKKLYLAGGVIGGLYLGSHTKIKYKGDKEKSRSNFSINPFKYDVTGRIGFGDFCVFANYSMTSLFKNNKGPELYPLTIGFSFPNF